MFEYAISAGEGTLLDYGKVVDQRYQTLWSTISELNSDYNGIYNMRYFKDGILILEIFRPASPDCVTGL